MMTPSVKRTPTTESLVELESERRAMYGTVVGKCLHARKRADVHVQRERKQLGKDYVSNRE